MGLPAVHLVLVVVLCLAATLPGLTIVHAAKYGTIYAKFNENRHPLDFRPITMPKVHKGCQEALKAGWTTSGVYSISLDNKTIDVYCEQVLDGGGWTVFQARKNGSVDFFQKWNMYKQGFGDLFVEFWLGNENIHLITKGQDQQLKIELRVKNEVKYADYTHFSITNEADKYRLNVKGYSGGHPPGDSLYLNTGKQFSTPDQDNDAWSKSCTTNYHGAWWYWICGSSNLNGLYGGTGIKGLMWHSWGGTSGMNATRLMMRKRP